MHRYGWCSLYYKHRRIGTLIPASISRISRVTVQLPIFNEHFVVESWWIASCRLQYRSRSLTSVCLTIPPRNPGRPHRIGRTYRCAWLSIRYHHRTNREVSRQARWRRVLATARVSSSPLLTLTSSQISFANITISRPEIGMVQTGGRISIATTSFLTEFEAILLDGHFVLEHSGRAQ